MLRSNEVASKELVYIHSVEPAVNTLQRDAKYMKILSKGRKVVDQQNNRKGGVDD